MGSSDSDSGYAVALDNSGSVYVTGSSDATWGSSLNPYEGDRDAFVARLITEDFPWEIFYPAFIKR